MAIFHLSVQLIKRSAGHSAVAAAAYRSGEKLKDRQMVAADKARIDGLMGSLSPAEVAAERQKKVGVFDYRRKQQIDHAEIITPAQAPAWMQDRERLWNGVEYAEKRKDAQLAREINVALPRELGLEQQKQLIRGYVHEQFVAKGMVADIAIHDAAGHNPHAHVLLTLREVRGGGFGAKNRSWNNLKNVDQWRAAWSDHANRALSDAGSGAAIDHRTLKAQGINREPQLHLGKDATQAIRKDRETPRHLRFARIQRRNALRLAFDRAGEKPAVLSVDKTQDDNRAKPQHRRGHWRER